MSARDPLTELLGVDSSEFLAADWERHPRHIGSATTSFRAALSLDDMDEVVSEEEVVAPRATSSRARTTNKNYQDFDVSDDEDEDDFGSEEESDDDFSD